MKIFPDHSNLVTRSPGPEVWSWIKYFGRIATDGRDPEVVVYGWETFRAGINRVGHLAGTDGGTVSGFIHSGRAIITTKDETIPITAGTFFVMRSPIEIHLGEETVVFAVENKAATIQVDTFGGPVKIDGRNTGAGEWIQTLFCHPWMSFPRMMRIRLDPGVHDVEEIKSQEMTRAFFVAGGVGHLHTADQDILLDPGLIVALMEGRKAGGIVTDQGLDLILVQPFKSRQPRKMETISEFLAIASPTAPP